MSDELVREVLEEGRESAYAYLMERWLTDAAALLRDVRREAGLSQEEVAERLGTKQPAIARMERDHEGRYSLRRFAEFLVACGVVPEDLETLPLVDARHEALAGLSPGEGR